MGIDVDVIGFKQVANHRSHTCLAYSTWVTEHSYDNVFILIRESTATDVGKTARLRRNESGNIVHIVKYQISFSNKSYLENTSANILSFIHMLEGLLVLMFFKPIS